jgi:hypothetical protein
MCCECVANVLIMCENTLTEYILLEELCARGGGGTCQ